MGLGKKVFTKKTYSAPLYKWSPLDNTISNLDANLKARNNKRPYYCSATPNSQGQDWVTTYVYKIIVVNGQQQRIAYVACDYVV